MLCLPKHLWPGPSRPAPTPSRTSHAGTAPSAWNLPRAARLESLWNLGPAGAPPFARRSQRPRPPLARAPAIPSARHVDR